MTSKADQKNLSVAESLCIVKTLKAASGDRRIPHWQRQPHLCRPFEIVMRGLGDYGRLPPEGWLTGPI